uniref:Uncharacterized protein n=1 Tax=Glossina brevipalpis TaxID=37001 RepID=A0A1A9WP67_9MUSC
MPDRFKVTKTEETDPPPDYLLEETVTGKLLNDLSDSDSVDVATTKYDLSTSYLHEPCDGFSFIYKTDCNILASKLEMIL